MNNNSHWNFSFAFVSIYEIPVPFGHDFSPDNKIFFETVSAYLNSSFEKGHSFLKIDSKLHDILALPAQFAQN